MWYFVLKLKYPNSTDNNFLLKVVGETKDTCFLIC